MIDAKVGSVLSSSVRCLTSLPRSGTHWLAGMIASVMGKEVLPGRYRDPKHLKRVLDSWKSEGLCVDHFEYDMHVGILNPKNYPGLKLAVLFRHPADSLISQYFYLKAQVNGQESLRLTFDEYFSSRMKGGAFRSYIEQRIMGWLVTNDTLQVRYEDLVADTGRELAKTLDFYKIPYSRNTLKEVVYAFRFEVLSGGRKLGEENPLSHYRIGIRDQWVAFLKSEQKKVLRDQIGDYLKKLRYEI